MKNETLLKIEEAAGSPDRKIPAPPPGWPLLRLGFRPFYLLAALFALLAVPLWLARYTGAWNGLPRVDVLWHMHEMVFGFALAVVIGFLFTAARNWTRMRTPAGPQLAALAGLWMAGRLAMLLAAPPLAAAVDLLFLPAAIVPLWRVMWISGNRGNLPLLVQLALLWGADLGFHAAVLGWTGWTPSGAVEAAILLLALLSTVMGGRVLPLFTANMAPGSGPRTHRLRDGAATALIAAASVAWIARAPAALTAPLALAAAVLHLWRLLDLSPGKTTRHPLLWVLHLAYAWIAVGYALLGAASAGYVGASAALHALAVGGISTLIAGMITRTALGHTGRPLRAGRAETAMFHAIAIAGAARVAANLTPAACYRPLLLTAGACWTLAFLMYLIAYSPYLCQPRLDGRDG